MSKFIELLKASIRRERQWEDTRTDSSESDFVADQEAVWRTAPPEVRAYPPTVPMGLGRH